MTDSPTFWELSPTDKFAYLFNTTALGLGVLLGIYSAWRGDWARVILVVILIKVYSEACKAFDAPGGF